MKQPAELKITKLCDRRYRYSLRMPSTMKYLNPTEQVWDITVEPETVTDLCNMIDRAVEQSNLLPFDPISNRDAFKAAGCGLYRELLPKYTPGIEDLQNTIRKLEIPLLVSTDVPDIFWELLFDPELEEFIGLKYDLGRRLITSHVPGAVPRRSEKLKCLLVADPNADEQGYDLPATAKEAEKLRSWFSERNIDCEDYLHGKTATRTSLLEKLTTNSYDIIHFAGHIVFDDLNQEYALRLNGPQFFGTTSIHNQVQGTPIVFLNGCWSGKAKGAASRKESVEGMTNAFLGAGAQVVIGSLFDVPDEGARAFAEKFYEESVLNRSTVGQAMRIARHHVSGSKEYGAAWACFVMYGDPCLSLELKEDGFQTLFSTIGLRRSDFEISCLRVLEQAFDYGSDQGIIATPLLFAAMIGGSNPSLRDALKEHNIAPTQIQDAFREAFSTKKKPSSHSGFPVFSKNTETILRGLRKHRQSDATDKISEQDLLEIFIELQGGRTGEILRSIGFNLDHVSRSRKHEDAKTSLSIYQVGPLLENDCSSDVWQILLRSVAIAGQSETPMIGTPHVFASMIQNRKGVLFKALQRFGFDSASVLPFENRELEGFAVKSSVLKTPSLPCSQNTANILALAQANATADKRMKISEGDLLIAFVRQGGGMMGKWLSQKGINIDALISKAFLSNGALDLSKFEETAGHIFEVMLICAQNKGHELLGRRHLLYALLIEPSGNLSKRLLEQGKDAELLADRLYVMMAAGQSVSSRLESKAAHMSPGLIKVICLAELHAKDAQEVHIGETHLLTAFLKDEADELGQFLLNEGVRLGRLM